MKPSFSISLKKYIFSNTQTLDERNCRSSFAPLVFNSKNDKNVKLRSMDKQTSRRGKSEAVSTKSKIRDLVVNHHKSGSNLNCIIYFNSVRLLVTKCQKDHSGTITTRPMV